MPYDLAAARKRFEGAQAFEEKQQKREIDDLSFYEGDGQWPEDIALARKGQSATGGMPAVPARPMITVNKVREPIRHVVNEERASDLGLEIVPADDFHELTGQTINEQEIELREGLVRRIQRESHAIDARIWAAERAAIAGRGYYGVLTQYLPGKTNDQEIIIRRFYNQGGVLLDTAHEQPDGSDAEEAWVSTWMGLDAYRREFPRRANDAKNTSIGVGEDEFRTLAEKQAGWFSTQGDVSLVRIVENWVYQRTLRGLATLSDGTVAWEDELPKAQRDAIVDTREVLDKAVKFYKLDGFDGDKVPIEQTDWPGQFIPIIKVVGEEIQPYDQERRYEGMVRPSRGPQRGYNYMVSKWVEMIGLTPVPPLMMTAAHVEGHTGMYQTMATRNWPYLLYNAFDPTTGKEQPPPARPPVTTDIAAIAGSVQLFDQAIKSTTAIPDATLGNVDPTVRSGKGIQALALNALKATAHFGDNFQRSVNYEGRILNDLLYPIYGKRPGRLARIVTKERAPKSVRVTVPGMPMPPTMAPPQPQAPTNQPQGQPPAPEPVYSLTPDATFNVAIKVTRNYDTLREQEASTVMEAVNSAPEFMWPLIGDLVFKYQDGPGHNELADRVKLALRPEVQASLNGQPAPNPQVMALTQQVQHLTQMLQGKVAETQAKGQIDLQKTQMQEQGDSQRAAAQQQTDMAKAELASATTLGVAQAKADAENFRSFTDALETKVGKLFDLHMQGFQQAHDAQQAQLDRTHEMVQALVGHQQALEQGQQQGQIASQQAVQAAALAPPPAESGAGA